MRNAVPAVALAASAALAVAPPAGAALYDEIQVYDDGIDAPGAAGLELHVNATPRGRRVPEFPREVVPEGATRLTAEFSYGLTPSLEAGLYVPTVLTRGGRYELAGAKLRMKWLPLVRRAGRGAFAGVNVELGRVARRFDPSPLAAEIRTIVGYGTDRWELAVDPTFGVPLSRGVRGGPPGFDLQAALLRRVTPEASAGLEYYGSFGRLGRPKEP